MEKIRIIEAGNELGLGGTEYAIQLYSKYLNKEKFDVTVVAVREGGARVQLIRELGITVIILKDNMTRLTELLKNTDVFHWHGYGTLDPEIFNIVKANKPKLVIQTNVFGAYSPSSLYDIIDYDLYISRMILIRRMSYDRGLSSTAASKRKVLHYPVDVSRFESLSPSESEIITFKRTNGLQHNFIIGRIGRPDNAKFDLITLDAFAEFASRVPEARFLLVGATVKMLDHAESLNIADKLILFENTANLQLLLLYYCSMDVFLAASEFGETFGMVIAEAMAAGIPVVTISTPDRDNAQVELVDNAFTGLVVERKAEMINEALQHLYQNKKLRKKLARCAQVKVNREYKAQKIVASLENLIFSHLKVSVPISVSSMLINYSKAMVDDYNHRCSDLWRPSHQI